MGALNGLDWEIILEKIANYATAETTKIAVQSTAPFDNKESALQQVSEILDAGEILKSGYRPHLSSLDLFSPWFLRLKKQAVLKSLEIKDVRLFCLETIALREALGLIDTEWSSYLSSHLMEATEPLSAIDHILTPSGDIRMDASEKLFRLHQEKDRLTKELQQTLDRLVKAHEMDSYLQDKYVTTREGRWVLPIKGGMKHHLPGVVHGSSQSKQTVFMEPEKVIPINNRLREVDLEIEDEVERLLAELSSYLFGLVNSFQSTRDKMERADLRLAQAQFAHQIEAQPFRFSDDKIDLIDLRHPILQLMQLNGKAVVPNSIHLSTAKSLLLLSGPNAGGKTVLLKSIGLAAQMARCGLPISAQSSSCIPFFSDLRVTIGDSQNVGEDLSTFAGHLKSLIQSASAHGPQALVLVDEICGSTDPEEGAALARSFIEYFSQNNVFSIITSHLGPLKTGWREESKIINGSLEYNSITGSPTYRFIMGVPGDSLALQTAKRVGVPVEILTRAIEILSPESRARFQKLDEIERLKSDILQLQEGLKQETLQARSLQNQLQLKIQAFEKDKEDWLQKTVKKAEKKITEAIDLAKASDALTRHRQLQEIHFQLPELVKEKTISRSNNGLIANNTEEFSKKFPPGSKVYVPSLGNDAIIQGLPNSKGEIWVLSGSLRLQVPWQSLKTPGKPQNPTAELVRRSGLLTVTRVDGDLSLDLRGKSVEEALQELERTLDHSVQIQCDRLKIIHGFGTEALKRAVRTYLSRSIYVKKWTSGSQETGGDGTTWVELAFD